MIILHVSNLRFNRRWYRWLLDNAPRHDLLVVAGNLVDHDLLASINSQREWVRAWLGEYGRPACIASGPEDRVFDPQANAWRPASWLNDVAHSVCVDDGFVEHGGFAVHCIRNGDMPTDRHADIWVAYRDPRVGYSGTTRSRDGGYDDVITISAASAAPIILTGDTMDRLHWRSMEKGTLHLNPGWKPSAPFPNHVLLDPATQAACRVSATDYIPKFDVLGPVNRGMVSYENSRPTILKSAIGCGRGEEGPGCCASSAHISAR
jgi:hypothetical protein